MYGVPKHFSFFAVSRIRTKMSIRPLSKELQAKAIAELNEEPNRVQADIDYIKEWLKQQPHLNPRLDDQLILTYLRGCKFSLEKTKMKFDSLYTLKALLPEFFTNRNPFDKQIQEVLKLGLFLPLLKTSGPDSPRVLLIRSGVTDPTVHKTETIFKVNIMISDIMLWEDDQCVVGGIVAFQDMTGITLNHMTHMSPSVVKKGMTFFEDAYPTRPKQMHFFNIPSFFDAMFSIVKPFLKEKMLQRIHVHNTTRIEDMYQYIPKSILPAEYGGDAGPVQDLIDHWKKKVEGYADWFKDDCQYISDESKRIGKPKTTSDLFGIEGSFRKLNVD